MTDGNGGDDRCLLYLVTPPAFDPGTFAGDLAAALDAGPVGAVQLRLKDVSGDDVRRAAEALLPLCRDRGVPLIMNDHPTLAVETDCDGVHVGQGDTPYKEARKIVGADRVVGVTCHASRHLAMEAAEAGADYVAFGAFFPTGTKEVVHQAEIDILRWWSELFVVPCVAIGGITADNCAPLVAAGADFLAVVSGVWQHPDGPAAAVRTFNKVIAETPRD
ncbi:MAG: thiamine phosphate synthase [Rhodospirillales bacterium CG15_BIG_FIL_POST_REV_8_21_14_020_66_15]|nr:MAG: thiamine phosphate synthase [Rhodospirillales bacterium CG15_BIG_FIL_POST_REV_8_21_14_020_66_15]